MALHLGRLLLVSGAETARVQTAVERFSAGLGRGVRLQVGHETLIVTVISGDDFRTKMGLHVAGTTVDMTAAAALIQIADNAAQGRMSVEQARKGLVALENARHRYHAGSWHRPSA